MTDDTKTPSITHKQRAAWLRLSNDPRVKDVRHESGATVESDAALIAPLLPPELTNPETELPTDPGYYQDVNGDVWRVWEDPADRMDILCDMKPGGHPNPGAFAPFRPLTPKQPPITRQQVRSAIGPVLVNVMNYPDELSAKMLGHDFTRLIDKAVDTIFSLYNTEA